MNTTGGHGHRHRTPYEQRKRLQKSEKETLKCCADYPLILNSPVGSAQWAPVPVPGNFPGSQ